MTIRHVVLFRFKPDASQEAVRQVEQAFAALADSIDEVEELEWGVNNSPEGKDRGFTHCFSLGFADAAARDAYLIHPTHKAFSGLAGPSLADVLVIDYDTQRRDR